MVEKKTQNNFLSILSLPIIVSRNTYFRLYNEQGCSYLPLTGACGQGEVTSDIQTQSLTP